MKKLLLLPLILLGYAATAQTDIFDAATLRTRINTEVITNNNNQITGAQLNKILNGILNVQPVFSNGLTFNNTYPYSLKLGGNLNQNTVINGLNTYDFSFNNIRTFSVSGAIALNLGSDATGDMYFRNAAGKLQRIAAGTDGQVLTLSGGLPIWTTGAGGGGLNYTDFSQGLGIIYNNSGQYKLDTSYTNLLYAPFTHIHSFASLTSKPTTLAGFGITDAVPNVRTLTINGETYDLSANRSWTITAGNPANLSLGTATATTLPIINSNGTGLTLPSVTDSTAGLMPADLFTEAYKTIYLQNTIESGFDSTLNFIGDTVVQAKAIQLLGGTNVTIEKNVTDTTISWTINAAGGAGGSSTFSGLTDVAITSPSSNQVPAFNSITSKWENKDAAVMNLTSPANGDVLKYNSAAQEWNNFAPPWLDSVTIHSSSNVDTLLNWSGGVSSPKGFFDRKDGLLNGTGIVTWSGTGLTFDVTAGIYYIGGTRTTSAPGSITLDAADGVNPRFDVIALDNTGSIVKITGTPAANPAAPQIDPSSQVYLTSVLVAAGATTPSGITSGAFWDENTESTGSASGVTVNFSNTVNPFHGTIAADVGTSTNASLSFTKGSILSATDYSTLKFYIRLKSSFSGNTSILVRFLNGNTIVSNSVTLSSGYGFNKNTTGAYQNVSIPLSDFSFISAAFDKIAFTIIGNSGGFYLDYIQLQSGVTNNNGASGLQAAYAFVTDGTNTAAASGSGTIKIRSADNKLSVAVANDDATHGDNVLLTINQSNLTLTQSQITNLTTDLAGKIDSLKRNSDSVYARKNGTWVYQFKDSVGVVGGGGSSETIVKPGDANYTALAVTQSIVYETTLTGNRTLTIPTASGNSGVKITVKNAQSTTFIVSLSSTSSILLDGSPFSVVNKGEWATIVSDGTSWYVVSSSSKVGSGVFVLKQFGTQSTLPNSATTQTFSYTVPAGTLTKAGDKLSLKVWYKTSGGGSDNINVNFQKGAGSIVGKSSTSYSSAGNEWNLELVYQTSTTTDGTQALTSNLGLQAGPGFFTSSTIDWTVANTFSIAFTTGATTTIIPMFAQYTIYKE